MPGLGEPVPDGQFTFTVNSLECGVTSVGDGFLEETPQGQFCLLNLTIVNTGDRPQSLFADNQYLHDSQGREFSADSTATLVIEGNDVWISEINPGNTITGAVVFDVPVGVEIVNAELHDSAYSGGVTVAVR